MTLEFDHLNRYARTRDADAFAALVSAYADMVYGVCLRVLGNTAEAEDAAQECFMRLAREAGRIHTSVGAWLHRCATNEALTRRRRAAAQGRLRHDYALQMTQEEASDDMTWAQLAPQVDAALDALPEEIRRLLVEHFLRRRSQGELAAEEGVSAATMSRRINQGIDMLRGHLRRAGVAVPAALLGLFLLEKTAAAATPAVMIGLGKMAMAGVGSAAPGAAAGGGAIGGGAIGGGAASGGMSGGGMVVISLAALSFLVVLLGALLFAFFRPTPAPPPAAPVRPVEPYQSEGIAPRRLEPNLPTGVRVVLTGEQAQPNRLQPYEPMTVTLRFPAMMDPNDQLRPLDLQVTLSGETRIDGQSLGVSREGASKTYQQNKECVLEWTQRLPSLRALGQHQIQCVFQLGSTRWVAPPMEVSVSMPSEETAAWRDLEETHVDQFLDHSMGMRLMQEADTPPLPYDAVEAFLCAHPQSLLSQRIALHAQEACRRDWQDADSCFLPDDRQHIARLLVLTGDTKLRLEAVTAIAQARAERTGVPENLEMRIAGYQRWLNHLDNAAHALHATP